MYTNRRDNGLESVAIITLTVSGHTWSNKKTKSLRNHTERCSSRLAVFDFVAVTARPVQYQMC